MLSPIPKHVLLLPGVESEATCRNIYWEAVRECEVGELWRQILVFNAGLTSWSSVNYSTSLFLSSSICEMEMAEGLLNSRMGRQDKGMYQKDD